jgi:hypothetical protein
MLHLSPIMVADRRNADGFNLRKRMDEAASRTRGFDLINPRMRGGKRSEKVFRMETDQED